MSDDRHGTLFENTKESLLDLACLKHLFKKVFLFWRNGNDELLTIALQLQNMISENKLSTIFKKLNINTHENIVNFLSLHHKFSIHPNLTFSISYKIHIKSAHKICKYLLAHTLDTLYIYEQLIAPQHFPQFKFISFLVVILLQQ